MRTVSMLDAKSNLSRLVDAVASGREREIIIARHGRPAARLVALEGMPSSKRLGVARGIFEVPDDIDRHNADVAKLFSGADVVGE